MKRSARKILIVLAYLALALGLCGCSLETSAENLFTLPQVPVEYTGLANTLNTYLESGYEYITPSSGNNIQSLQMIDMDGDGEKEAVAFFRHTARRQPPEDPVFPGGKWDLLPLQHHRIRRQLHRLRVLPGF